MKYEGLVALERDRASIADVPRRPPEDASVSEAAMAYDYDAQASTDDHERQIDLFRPSIVRPAAEQAVIDRALEILARRLRRPEQPLMENPQAAVDYAKLMVAEEPSELFGIMHLDTRHRMLKVEIVARGTIDGAAVYPREIVRSVIAANSAAILCFHQHPSQNPSPSEADRGITKKLGRALALIDVRLLDHIVIGGTEHVSLAEQGWI